MIEYICSYCGHNGLLDHDSSCPLCGQPIGLEMAEVPAPKDIQSNVELEEYSQVDGTHWACNGMGCPECLYTGGY